MKGARKADRKKAVKLAFKVGIIPDKWHFQQELKNEYFNPYEHKITASHVIYIHSGIEHFIKVA